MFRYLGETFVVLVMGIICLWIGALGILNGDVLKMIGYIACLALGMVGILLIVAMFARLVNDLIESRS